MRNCYERCKDPLDFAFKLATMFCEKDWTNNDQHQMITHSTAVKQKILYVRIGTLDGADMKTTSSIYPCMQESL